MDDWGDIDIDALMKELAPICPDASRTFASKQVSPTPTPTAPRLAASLVSSSSRLFFISWQAPATIRREWHLVRINLEASLSLNPECLHNGKFLSDFCICHPKDRDLHPRNQRWWIEYHAASSAAKLHQGDYHILRPDENSALYAKQNQLFPFSQWLNLLHDPTFVHGPFEFAVVNGRKTRDRICDDDWKQLIAAKEKYDDAPPNLQMNDFTGVQFSRSFHTSISDSSVHDRVIATHYLKPENSVADPCNI
jgi:hypothetical protein